MAKVKPRSIQEVDAEAGRLARGEYDERKRIYDAHYRSIWTYLSPKGKALAKRLYTFTKKTHSGGSYRGRHGR